MNGNSGTNSGPIVSGGDIRAIEIAKRLQLADFEVSVLTTPAGRSLCLLFGLEARFYINPANAGRGVFSNVLSLLVGLALVPVLLGSYRGVLYSTSEYLYDVLPAAMLRLLHRRSRWIAVVHNPFATFTESRVVRQPALRHLARGLNGYLAGWLVRRFCDRVLTVSAATRRSVIRDGQLPAERVFAVDCGLDEPPAAELSADAKEYDALYMKRVEHPDALDELFMIWGAVCKARPSAKLALMGAFPGRIGQRLETVISTHGVRNNVHLLGVVYDRQEKLKVIARSRVLIHPSYSDNWAIVIGEALISATPVICYRIPPLEEVWGPGVTWVDLGDTAAFADSILGLVTDEGRLTELGVAGREFAARYAWPRIAATELELLRSLPTAQR